MLLATGGSFITVTLPFQMGKTAVSEIVKDPSNVIWYVLRDEYWPTPTTEMCLNIDENCANRWNFLCCIWCTDGKNTEIKFPARSGSKFYDYKHFFSILLHAAIDSKCRLSTVGIGAVGRQMDAGSPEPLPCTGYWKE